MSRLKELESLQTKALQTKRCPICESIMGIKLVKNNYEIVQCLECDFLCVNPMPSAQKITDYYATAYRGATEDWYPKDLDRRWRAFTRSLLFVRYILGKDVVDLGCGGGQMLQALGRFAKSATGVDLSSNSIAFARKHFAKHTFYDEPLSTFAQRGLTYDFVFSSELLEHLADPHEFMRTVSQITRPGGLVYLSAPDAGHAAVPIPLKSWTDICPPEHLQWFSEHNLNLLFQQYGFRPHRRFRSKSPAHSAMFQKIGV
jgi:2-polyprenyl-3-methyl-5-hydroxy-6-metoxy-1,4-benzoquinol methylase